MNGIRRVCIALALIVGLWTTSQTTRKRRPVVGPPTWTSTSIQSTGGITYFINAATLPICDYHKFGPVTIVGTNLSMSVTRMKGSICPFCLDCNYSVTQLTVLGQLPGGAYRLHLYTLDPK